VAGTCSRSGALQKIATSHEMLNKYEDIITPEELRQVLLVNVIGHEL
jgi:hypothetical protein